ncbi:hypothetical protein SSS_10587 [Sarcoptes scabiei]|nr:hypothetical protein SSS_10587 [Sarcoptes scabiei]
MSHQNLIRKRRMENETIIECESFGLQLLQLMAIIVFEFCCCCFFFILHNPITFIRFLFKPIRHCFSKFLLLSVVVLNRILRSRTEQQHTPTEHSQITNHQRFSSIQFVTNIQGGKIETSDQQELSSFIYDLILYETIHLV